MALIKRFTPGGNFYPDGSSTFAMLREFFQAWAENRDVLDGRIVADAVTQAGDAAHQEIAALEPETIIRGRSATPQVTGAAWRQTTEDGHYLPLGYREDGHLDDFARRIFREDVTGSEELPTHPDYARAWITDDGTSRLLMGFRWDGTIDAPGLTGVASAGPVAVKVYTDAPYTAGSNVLPVHTNTSRIAIWGSSSAELIGPELATVATELGASLTEGGKGAERAEHIAARLGSAPALLVPADGSMAIPASGAVTVTSPTFGPWENLRAYTGTWAGVHGTLSSTSTTLTFTRTTAGDQVTIEGPTPIHPDLGLACRADVTLLWMGKNNTGNAGAADFVIRTTDAAHDWLAPLQKRCLVLGHFVDMNQPATSNQRTNVTEINAAHAARYGAAFLDVQAYLTGTQVWTDTGITPTQADLDQQAAGNKPPSLSTDNGHLNAAADTAVANLIRDRLTSLGWY